MKKFERTEAFTKTYAAPMIEVVEIAVEQGFAASIENLGETKEDQEW